MAATKHKIKMDETTLDLRANFFTRLEPSEYNQKLINQLSKPERAEMIYRFQLAGQKIATLCKLYGISSGYQRELRGLNEKEWAINLLNCDESFIQWMKNFHLKYPDIKEDSIESITLIHVFVWYLFVGVEYQSEEQHMKDFDEIVQSCYNHKSKCTGAKPHMNT